MQFSNNVSIIARESVIIGDLFLCGDNVRIIDADFHEISPSKRFSGTGKCSPVTIGNNVWLGSNVMILKGVTIGDGCVIAPGSIVTHNIAPHTLAVGIPAKVIRSLKNEISELETAGQTNG